MTKEEYKKKFSFHREGMTRVYYYRFGIALFAPHPPNAMAPKLWREYNRIMKVLSGIGKAYREGMKRRSDDQGREYKGKELY